MDPAVVAPLLEQCAQLRAGCGDRGGIEMARGGNRVGDIGHAVQSYVEENGFSVVRSFVGHGVGGGATVLPMTVAICTLLVPLCYWLLVPRQTDEK